MGNSLKKIDKHEKSLNLIFNSWSWKLNNEMLFYTVTLTKIRKTNDFPVGKCVEYKRV